MSARTTTRLLASAGALVALAFLAAPAQARPGFSMAGVGTSSVPAEGAATFEGELHGTPLSGPYVGRLEPADGTIPAMGTCEQAAAHIRVQDEAGRFVELAAATGTVCTTWQPLGTMRAFDGRFEVVATSERRLRKVAGHMQVRLLGDLSDVYAAGS